MNLVLNNSLYNTRSARSQTSSINDVFCEEKIEDAVKFMSSAVALEAQSHSLLRPVDGCELGVLVCIEEAG